LTFDHSQLAISASPVPYTNSLSLANFVGSVVGFLKVLVIRLRSILLAEADSLKAKWYYYQINKGGADQRRLFPV
jgi:hypothetical protein